MRRVSTTVIVWILTALAAVVVVLTRVRFSGEGDSGQFRIGPRVLLTHTVAGGLAVLVWVVYLIAGSAVVGIVALALWWVTALAGLLVLLRWMPARGRHAVTATHDSWSEGPGLSLLAHVGMVVGVLVFTGVYLTGAA
jgi:hypothetical protein